MAKVAAYLASQPAYQWFSQFLKILESDTAIVLVTPSSNKFNDFGTQASIDILVMYGSKQITIATKMILKKISGDRTEFSTSEVFRGLLNEHPIKLELALKDYQFLSAVGSRKDYRELISLLGSDLAIEALKIIHDSGALQRYEPENSDLQVLRQLPAFGQSLFRSDESFVAAFDLAAMLIPALANEMNFHGNVKFRARAPQLSNDNGLLLSFETNVIEDNRICVLIGENGVGKTHILKNLAETFGALDFPPDSINEDNFYRPFRVLQIPSPLDSYRENSDLPRLKLRQHPATKEGWKSITRNITHFLRDTKDEIEGLGDYALLKRALAPFFDFQNLALPLLPGASQTYQIVLDDSGVPYSLLRHYLYSTEGRRSEFFGLIDFENPPAFIKDGQIFELSSGERALFGLAVIALCDIERGSLVLLDEPELSLHPKMIAELMRLLGFILNARQAHCVIATHSLYVIREAPSEAVHVLQKQENGKTDDFFPMLATLGAGLTELSNVVFNDVHIREYFAARIENLVEAASPEDIQSMLPEMRRLIGEAGTFAMNRALDARNNGKNSKLMDKK